MGLSWKPPKWSLMIVSKTPLYCWGKLWNMLTGLKESAKAGNAIAVLTVTTSWGSPFFVRASYPRKTLSPRKIRMAVSPVGINCKSRRLLFTKTPQAKPSLGIIFSIDITNLWRIIMWWNYLKPHCSACIEITTHVSHIRVFTSKNVSWDTEAKYQVITFFLNAGKGALNFEANFVPIVIITHISLVC